MYIEHKNIPLILAVLVVLVFPSISMAEESQSLENEPDRLFNFAEFLFKTKDYYRAITEYKRFINYFPHEPRVETSAFKIGLSYYESNHWTESSTEFFRFYQKYPLSRFRSTAWFLAADSLFKNQDLQVAWEEFKKMEDQTPDNRLYCLAQLRKAWIDVYRFNWHEAATQLNEINPNCFQNKRITDFETKCKMGKNLPQKSPNLAGLLSSLVPGTGQVYAKRYSDGIAAFLLNGVFIWAAIRSFDNDNPTAGSILLFFELGWYTGNIYSAVNSAHKFNQEQNQKYLQLMQVTFTDLYNSDRLLFHFRLTLP